MVGPAPAEVPGLDQKDLDVRLAESHVTIRGEKRSGTEDEREGNLYRRERFYGSFQRTIPLPGEVDVDQVDARFRNGVLIVRLPKTEAARRRTRKIPVRVG